jgi:[acyl-carrier-protein] S-malonyltransferase
MLDLAFLFPGQGSQFVGMVHELAPHPEARAIFQEASRILGFDLFDLCLRGPEEKLAEDLYAQLAVHVTNCAYAAILKRMKVTPRLGSGFSLGIFSALVAAGSLSFEQGLKGVRIAAEKMTEEGRHRRGAMAAVIGLPEGEVQALCQEVPLAFVASVNTAGQVVISGEEEGVQKALDLCRQRGALLAKRLATAWAIHTPLMEGVSRAFAEIIRDWEIHPPLFPVLGYRKAEFLRSPSDIKEELSAQFSQPNSWYKVLLRLLGERIGTFIEVGPGSVLAQMVRWVSRQALALTAEEILNKGEIPPAEKLGPDPLGVGREKGR